MANVLTESCVLCMVDTGIPCTTSIDRRSHYVEGGGQMCRDCHHGYLPGVCRCVDLKSTAPNQELPAYRIM